MSGSLSHEDVRAPTAPGVGAACSRNKQGSRLRARFVDHLFPDALGFENQLDQFARGSFAAGSLGSVIRRAFHLRRGVAHGNSEPDAAHDHQVGQIVAEIGDFGFLGASLSQNIFVSRDFVPLFFVNEFHIQLFASAPQRRAAPSSNDARAQACGHGESESLAVMRVEGLHFQRVVVWRGRQRYATVGERAVYIHQQHGNLLSFARHSRGYLHALCTFSGFVPFFSVFSAHFVIFALNLFFSNCGCYINSSVHKSCKCTTPRTRRASSTTTTEVIFFFSIRLSASLASTCAPMVCGVFVMPSAARISRTAPRCFSIKRRKSPSVRIPASRPSASSTVVMPRPFALIS